MIEHLWVGIVGHLALLSSFVFTLFGIATYCFSVSSKTSEIQKQSSRTLANFFFIAHFFAIILAFGLLLFMIFKHYFEYKYVWQHSSLSLPFKYLLSSIWEGQEGSFLLWAFWHGMIGTFLIWRKPIYYAEVLIFVLICQSLICSMLLGIYIGDVKIGSNPFVLMKEFYTDAPIFQQANYLQFIKDGNGLNELLQNYWMVIHPPVLFLGFSLCILPFAYVCVALWKGDKKQTLEKAQIWGLWALGILGLGIMMGGAWAYESLSFGGYWAWDPVENASLVPWLILIAAVHSGIISMKRNKSYRTTFILFGLSFVFVLYSTYLTRSGILGDTSVHSFTDLEMGLHLICFLVISIFPFFFLLFKNWNNIYPNDKNNYLEDHISSREFWMSTGIMVLFFSSLYIIIATSLPVFNKLFHTSWSVGTNAIFTYNRVLIWSAIFILLLSFWALYLKFKTSPVKETLRKLRLPFIIYLAISLWLAWAVGFEFDKEGLAFQVFLYITFVASSLAMFLNAHHWFIGSRKFLGTQLSHVGFALMIVGILISASNKKVISYNYSEFIQDFGENSTENPLENITLIKNAPQDMGNYKVNYLGDSIAKGESQKYFVVEFTHKETGESFRLYPNAFINPKGNQGLLANPDKKHFLFSDLFVYITSIPDPNQNRDNENFVDYITLKAYVFPFINLLWLGIIILVIGLLVAAFERRKKIIK